ncbi:predicted protein [Uncinocarpus reesii 1704]|uniref:Uncharacterized protein n=1 Tax=Uncinocarpus reesii (strain UAMH 1704) TaxID=336963 RepID=C4JYE4_UNCRE|nr:uncharacterized protein UREG_07195 [Uncinocarpus reesii 1704]EEP82330.1 predicted protein [Uncinocarpus reesii 1704]
MAILSSSRDHNRHSFSVLACIHALRRDPGCFLTGHQPGVRSFPGPIGKRLEEQSFRASAVLQNPMTRNTNWVSLSNPQAERKMIVTIPGPAANQLGSETRKAFMAILQGWTRQPASVTGSAGASLSCSRRRARVNRSTPTCTWSPLISSIFIQEDNIRRAIIGFVRPAQQSKLFPIIFRCTYRLLGTLKAHPAIQQRWHSDDSWMAFSLLPLISRSVCIAWFFHLRATETPGDDTLAKKLVIPSRVTYALLYWSSADVSPLYFRMDDVTLVDLSHHEIVCASIVANAAFYYALWKEIPRWRGQQAHSTPLIPYFLPLEQTGSESRGIPISPSRQSDPESSSEVIDSKRIEKRGNMQPTLVDPGFHCDLRN